MALHQLPHMWRPGAAAAGPTPLLTLTVMNCKRGLTLTVEVLEAPRRSAPDLYLDVSNSLAKNLLLFQGVSRSHGLQHP